MGIIRSGVRMSAGELGCTYASLILHDDGQSDGGQDQGSLESRRRRNRGILARPVLPRLQRFRGWHGQARYHSSARRWWRWPGPAAAAGGGDAAADKKKSSSEDDEMAAPAASIFGDEGDDY